MLWLISHCVLLQQGLMHSDEEVENHHVLSNPSWLVIMACVMTHLLQKSVAEIMRLLKVMAGNLCRTSYEVITWCMHDTMRFCIMQNL
jgi:hypothetical protein